MKNKIVLPEPEITLEFPLMKAIQMRRSKRKWSSESLSLQEISNILWVACGITKPETKWSKSRRTAPSAMNSQAISVYISMKEGVFRYDEKSHSMFQILSDDLRKYIGTQKMMHSAPVGLIYVSDYSKMKGYLSKNEHRKLFVSGTEVGHMSQNVYLYCTATQLNTVELGLVDRETLLNKIQLTENHHIIYTQVIGRALQ